MGTSWWDKHTYEHFRTGVLVMLAFSSRRTFLIANLVHLIIELCEVHTCASGERMESFSNHVSDTIAFLIGTAVGSELKRRLNLRPFWLICHMIECFALYIVFC